MCIDDIFSHTSGHPKDDSAHKVTNTPKKNVHTAVPSCCKLIKNVLNRWCWAFLSNFYC